MCLSSRADFKSTKLADHEISYFSANRMRVFFFVLLSLQFGHLEAETGTLKFVQAIWRHGDRAPSSLPYPKDRYDESFWPRGWAQLTNVGMRQLDKLGKFFRKRYVDSFLDKKFNVSQLYVHSSDSDRALVSAQAMLHGFYPPDKKERFDEKLEWQPLPVHSSGLGDDPLLRPTDYECPYYDQLADEFKKPLIDELNLKYKDLLEFLPSVTGQSTNFTVEDAAELDDISREIAHDLKQADWVKRKWSQYEDNTTLEIVGELQRLLRDAEFGSFELAFLRGGFLLNDWVEHIEKVVRGNQTKPSRMLLYSAHDGTLLSLLHVLNLSDGQLVPYAACVILELHEVHGRFFVELFYRHDDEISALIIDGCNRSCPLDQFLQFAKSRSIESEIDLEMYCQITSSHKNPINNVQLS